MASFNLTAELNIRGPSNLNRVVADIRRQLSTVSLDVNINPNTSRGIQAVTRDVRDLSAALRDAQTNAVALGGTLRGIGASFNNVSSSIANLNNGLGRISGQSSVLANSIKGASSEMSEFGKQSALAIRRFAAFSIATGAVYALARSVTSAYSEFIVFNKEFTRLKQVTESTSSGLSSLASEITRLSTGLGVSSSELLKVSSTLAQAGLSAGETKKALEALAKSSLAPSFDSLNDTVEGSIALMRQFGIGAGQLESALGSVNAVAAKFAVESKDIITAIQRTGGVFAAASKGVSEGKDALNEFLAIFTSVRATTRESAETIATGLRTIFTRVQRASTIDALKEYGVVLTDLEGKFVGPYEATKRLAEGLSKLDPRDLRFSKIVEELGGFRQIGKVIPLIQQFTTAQQALGVAQKGSGSLAADAATAQEALAVRITKVREQFVALIRDVGQSQSFQAFADVSLKVASALITVADAAKDVLPAIAAITAIRGIGALGQFVSGFSGGIGRTKTRGFASGGVVPGSGNRDTVPAMLTPGEFVIRKKAVEKIGANNLHKINKGSSAKTQKFSSGGFTKAMLVDDITENSRNSILPSKIALEKILQNGYAALDFDRTLKRTIGDSAYGKAKSPEQKNAVLEKYFRNSKNRLLDAKSSKLTQFGSSLQEAIRSGKVDPKKLSIISKSSRTPGLAEHINELFGIPISNMVFTSGGSKDPALDAIRSKGPRFGRIAKKFAAGGKIVQQDSVGAAILKGRSKKIESIPKSLILSSKKNKEAKEIIESSLSNKESFQYIKEPLSKTEYGEFKTAINKGIIIGLNKASSILYGKIPGIPSKAVSPPQKNINNFLSSINEGVKGSFFEGLLDSIMNQGVWQDSEKGTTQPFDFPNGLGGESQKLFPSLSMPFVDAKASFPVASNQKMAKKIANQILLDEGSSSLSGVKKTSVEKMDSLKSKIFARLDPNKKGGYSLSEISGPTTQGGLGISGLKSKDLETLVKEGTLTKTGRYYSLARGYANGGSIEDTVPALLTPGEFVINKSAAQKLGSARLNKLNKADKIQGFNKGGFVSSFASGGSVLSARPNDPTGLNVSISPGIKEALDNISKALTNLGISASSSAALIEKGGAVSVRAAERAYEADLERLKIAGASAEQINEAEQALGNIRNANARKIDTAREFAGFGGDRLQSMQFRAEAERERITNNLRSRGATDEQINSVQTQIRSRAYENVAASDLGTSRRGLRARGVDGSSIEEYINQSKMNMATLKQMDKIFITERTQQIYTQLASEKQVSGVAYDRAQLAKQAKALAIQEAKERKAIVQEIAKDRGLTGSNFAGKAGSFFKNTGAAFGLGSFTENSAVAGGGIGGRLNRGTEVLRNIGMSLSFAGGILGSSVGGMVGGKKGAAIEASTSAFATSVGIGAMFGPIGALTGVVVGATSAIKAWRDALNDATLAEEQTKVEFLSTKTQKMFDRLGSSNDPREKSALSSSIIGNLKETQSSFLVSQQATFDKLNPTGFLGLFKGKFDTTQFSKELSSLAKNNQVGQFLPQIFEQQLRQGKTADQIKSSFGSPQNFQQQKEMFALSQGDPEIARLMAERYVAKQENRNIDANRIDTVLKKMVDAIFNEEINKAIANKINAEQKVAEAASAATLKINMFAESLKDIDAATSKAETNFQALIRETEINAGNKSGDKLTSPGIDRRDENILSNIRGYSLNTIQNQIAKTGNSFGFNQEIIRQAQTSAQNQKILSEELPKILNEIAARESIGINDAGEASKVVGDKLRELFKNLNIDTSSGIVEKMTTKLGEMLRQRQNTNVAELLKDNNAINEVIGAGIDTETLKVFNDLIKKNNDVLALMNDQATKFADTLSQASEMKISAQNIGIEADNQLNKALGRSVSLSSMNAPFNNTIERLTSRVGTNGSIIPGTGTFDPKEISRRLDDANQRRAAIVKEMDSTKPAVGSDKYNALSSALIKTTTESNNLQKALDKLTSDSSRASSALSKIDEIVQQRQNRQSGFMDILKNINNFEWMSNFVESVSSLDRVNKGVASSAEIPSAIEALERRMSMARNPEEASKMREDFIKNAAEILNKENPQNKELIDQIIKTIGADGQLSPEMKGLIDEFYKYNTVQQSAIEQAANRMIEGGKEVYTSLTKGGQEFRATVSAAGQNNPVQVLPAQQRANGGIIYASRGTMVDFKPRGTDTVPAMLTRGEFVVNARAAQKNIGLLEAINSGNTTASGYSKGGVVYLAKGGSVDDELQKARQELNKLNEKYKDIKTAEYIQEKNRLEALIYDLENSKQSQQVPQAPKPQNPVDSNEISAYSQEKNNRKQQYLADKEAKKQAFLSNNPARAEKELEKKKKQQEERNAALQASYGSLDNAEKEYQRSGLSRSDFAKDAIIEYRRKKNEKRAEMMKQAATVSPKKSSNEEQFQKDWSSTIKTSELLRKIDSYDEFIREGTIREWPESFYDLSRADQDALRKGVSVGSAFTDGIRRKNNESYFEQKKKQSDEAWKIDKAKIATDIRLATEQKRKEEEREKAGKKTKENLGLITGFITKSAVGASSMVSGYVQQKLEESRKNRAISSEKQKKDSEKEKIAANLAIDNNKADNLYGQTKKEKINEDFDKFNSQLQNPKLIEEETKALRQRLQDSVNASIIESSNAKKERDNRGYFGAFKTALTFSDPNAEIIRMADQRRANMGNLLSILNSELSQDEINQFDKNGDKKLSDTEKSAALIARNNRISSSFRSLLLSETGKSNRNMTQDMFDQEQKSISVARDMAYSAATAFMPVGAGGVAAGVASKLLGQGAKTLAGRVLSGSVAGAASSLAGGAFKKVTDNSDDETNLLSEFISGGVLGGIGGALFGSKVGKELSRKKKTIPGPGIDPYPAVATKRVAEAEKQAGKLASIEDARASRFLAEEEVREQAEKAMFSQGFLPSRASGPSLPKPVQINPPTTRRTLSPSSQSSPSMSSQTTRSTPGTKATINKTPLEKAKEAAIEQANNQTDKQMSKSLGLKTQDMIDAGTRPNKVYEITEDMGRITAADRRQASKSVSRAANKSQKAQNTDKGFFPTFAPAIRTVGRGVAGLANMGLQGAKMGLRGATNLASIDVVKPINNIYKKFATTISEMKLSDMLPVPNKSSKTRSSPVKSSGRATVPMKGNRNPEQIRTDTINVVERKRMEGSQVSANKPVIETPKVSGAARVTSEALEKAKQEAEGLRFRGNVSDKAYTPYLKEWDEMMDMGVPNEYRTYGVGIDSKTQVNQELARKIEKSVIERMKALGKKTRGVENLLGSNHYFGDYIQDANRQSRSFGIVEQKINRAGDTRKMLQIYGDDPTGRRHGTILYSIPLEEAESLGLSDKLLKKGYSRFASGGMVYASKGTLIPYEPRGTDTVPAMLTPGEFVVNRAATQKHLPLLKSINNNSVPGYSKGGPVQYFDTGSDGPISAMSNSSSGVSSIGLDTSGLKTAFDQFGGYIQKLDAALKAFGEKTSEISKSNNTQSSGSNSPATGGLPDTGSRDMQLAAASISSASNTFSATIANFNTSVSSLEKVLSNMPSTIDFKVSGSIPVNITIEGGGTDLEFLNPFKEEVYAKIENGVRKALPGVNIEIQRS